MDDAIARRAERELGVSVEQLEPLLPDFRYRAVDASGVVENEICPVFRAVTRDEPNPRSDEIAEFAWVDPVEFRSAVIATPFAFSPWVGWQLAEMDAAKVRFEGSQ
jgi:isopentenyl-diphosphate delta-isomerase